VRASRVVLATGAIERPLLFAGNDTPGVMLSSAVRTYVQRFAVLAGQEVAIATCTEDAYLTALAVLDAGAKLAVVLDSRPAVDSELVRRVSARAPVLFGASVIKAEAGRRGVTGIEAVVAGARRRFDCDLIAVSGGFTPVAHLHMQAGGGLRFEEALGAFVPTTPRQAQKSAGAAAGCSGLARCLEDGWTAGAAAALRAGADGDPGRPPRPEPEPELEASIAGSSYGTAEGVDLKTSFVDLQNDVTAADVDLAWREGYRSVEHLKRYTTLGMATDQGKTSNLVGLARLVASEGLSMAQAPLTTFRPPYTPTTLGLLGGDAVGEHAAPLRLGPLHEAHRHNKALWQPSGYWTRPRAFPRPGESLPEAALREARAVRTLAGLTDISTLAKFEIAGPDAANFLECVCATPIARLAQGRGRYTFMLREDGFVVDDGTVWRIDEQRYLLTSSTGGADRMDSHLSYVRRMLAPDLKLSVANVQEHWAAMALAGPGARAILSGCLDAEPPRHMTVIAGVIAKVAVRVLAASYSGERAFEIYAPAHEILPVWRTLSEATQAAGGALYGLEALELLRIEKGHVEVGAEIDGRRTPADLGLSRMLNPRGGYLGAACLARPALQAQGRQALVGLEAKGPIPEGAMLITHPGAAPQGHVSSAGLRLTGQGGVALGLLAGGLARQGERLLAVSPTRGLKVEVTVALPHFHDPEGARYRD